MKTKAQKAAEKKQREKEKKAAQAAKKKNQPKDEPKPDQVDNQEGKYYSYNYNDENDHRTGVRGKDGR